MKSVRYTEEAEADLLTIGIYTWKTWGEAQYEKYLAILRECCESVLPRLRHLREVPDHPGLYRYHCERHVVFFRVDEESVQIIRILHERMLPTKYL